MYGCPKLLCRLGISPTYCTYCLTHGSSLSLSLFIGYSPVSSQRAQNARRALPRRATTDLSVNRPEAAAQAAQTWNDFFSFKIRFLYELVLWDEKLRCVWFFAFVFCVALYFDKRFPFPSCSRLVAICFGGHVFVFRFAFVFVCSFSIDFVLFSFLYSCTVLFYMSGFVRLKWRENDRMILCGRIVSCIRDCISRFWVNCARVVIRFHRCSIKRLIGMDSACLLLAHIVETIFVCAHSLFILF